MPVQISDEQIARINSMWAGGARIVEIIRETGLTRNTVAQRIQGVPQRPTARAEQFTTYSEFSGLYGDSTKLPITTVKPRIRVKAGSTYRNDETVCNSGGLVRVVVVADTHDNGNLSNERFEHIGKFVADAAPDYLVHLGDWADFEFASRFEDWGSIHGRERSPFRDEMDSLCAAIEKLQTPIAHMSKPPKLITTCGNHDARIWDFENGKPELEGMMWSEFEKALSDWEIHPYKTWAFIEGVGFSHIPINKMGKPYGGKTVSNQVANDTTFSVVFGHTHEYQYLNRGKLGPNNAVSVINCPAALPQGYVKPYAMLATTGWAYGVTTLEIQDGRVLGHGVTSMELLERRYG